MIKFLAKSAPDFTMLACLTVCLAILFGYNWLMADLRGNKIVKYSDECIVGEYNVETNTGSLTCGEYTKKDGTAVVPRFVGKVYIKKIRSNSSTFGPVVSQSERRTSTTA